MHFGLAIDLGPGRGTRIDGAEVRRLVSAAEAGNITTVWVGEHYEPHKAPFHPSAALPMLGYLAGLTNLGLATGVLLIPAHLPSRLRFDLETLLRLTDGPIQLGLGLGGRELWQRFSIRDSGSGKSVGDQVDAWLTKFRYEIENAGVEDRLRVLIGGKTERSIKRALQLGDGYVGSSTYPKEVMKSLVQRYRENHQSSQVALNRIIVVAESDREVDRLVKQYVNPVVARYAMNGSVPGFTNFESLTPEKLSEIASSICVIGTPDQISADLADYEEIGVTQLNLRPAFGTVPVERSIETLALFNETIQGRKNPKLLS